jgi:hypothetical protein
MSLTISLTTWQDAVTANIEAATRMNLTGGEVMSVAIHPDQARVRVITGQAWISYEGQDYFLSYGEEMTLPRGKFDAIVTALYNKPLTFELLPNGD